MRPLLVIAGTVLAALVSGCASPVGRANESDSVKAMNEHTKLSELVGQWSGSNRLWVMPGDPVRESKASATVVSSGSALALITYTWEYEGKAQAGTLAVRTNSEAGDVEVVLMDSWHTANKFMLFHGDEDNQGLVAVRGSYPAPPGPNWGWRIVVEASSADAFCVRMYNITPAGEEAIAVETQYERAAT